MSAPNRERRPWPMKWIVIAIIAVIIPYTYLTLRYRRPEKSFEPYHDIKDRANTLRLLNAGFQRVLLDAERPADPPPGAGRAPSLPASGGLPAALGASLVEAPLLPASIDSVRAAANASSRAPYQIEFVCTLPDNKQQFGAAYLYARGEEVYILPSFERLTGSLLARTRDSFIRLTVPTGALKPGHYRVVLVGAQASRSWILDLN